MGHCKHYSHFRGMGDWTMSQEYQENESGLVVEDVGISQTVNLFGCKNSTVQIKGKVNAVTIGMRSSRLLPRSD
jgi:hypothetical protein